MDRGKERVDKIALKLYNKEWEDLAHPDSKYRALAVALDDAENEIEELQNQLRIAKSNSLP